MIVLQTRIGEDDLVPIASTIRVLLVRLLRRLGFAGTVRSI